MKPNDRLEGERAGQVRVPIVPQVVRQHVEDVAVLHSIRTKLAFSPHVKLKHIRRFDDRVAAHLDGLFVSGKQGWPLIDEALAPLSAGALFAAAVMAIESKSVDRLSRLYALAEAVPEAQRGLMSAFGWVEREKLRGIVSELLTSTDPFFRYVGVTACSLHRVDLGSPRDGSGEAITSRFHARGLRLFGELGKRDSLRVLLRQLHADDESSRFWAAWSAVLLGNRGAAVAALAEFGATPGAFRPRAFQLSMQAMNLSDSREWLRGIAQNPADLRYLIQGSGIAGDPGYIPWLIGHMTEKRTARIAGEAFSLVTGLDLAYLDLDRKPPEDTGAGPNDDPEDPGVEMDEDDGLPWPDPDRVADWWQANGGRFDAGARYFLGAPVTRENCLRVLKEGFQRQRILAAHYLCLLEPGTTLFEWRAPAARQQRLLAAMV